jgi:hypothetical protein
MLVDDLHRELFNTEDDVYAVIDGAAVPALLAKLEEHEPEHTCLFRGELPFDLAETAPYLVNLTTDDDFSHWLLEIAKEKPCCVFYHSKKGTNFHTLRKHFRSLLKVTLPDERIVHFRFYDPRVISTFLSNPDEVLEAFLQNDVTKIRFIDNNQLVSSQVSQ